MQALRLFLTRAFQTLHGLRVEVVPWLRTLAGLSEDPGLVLNNITAAHIHLKLQIQEIQFLLLPSVSTEHTQYADKTLLYT